MKPTSLALTSGDDVLVVDTDHNRILMMDSSLSLVEKMVLPVHDTIQQPWGLHLDQSRARLYVGENSGNLRVLVFDVAV